MEPPSVDTDSLADLEEISVTNDNDSPHENTITTLGTDVKSDRFGELGTDGATLQQDTVEDSPINETNESRCTDQADIIFGNDKVKLNESKRPMANKSFKTSKQRVA